MSIPISAYFWSMQKIEFVYHFRAFTFELFSTFVYMFGMWQFVVYELNEAEPCIAQDDTNQSWNAQISGQQQVKVVGGLLKQFDRHFLWWWFLPRILLMLELCISGQFFRILRRSSLAQIINAFMGRLMWGLLSLSFLGWRIILAPKTKIKWKTEFVLP